MKRNEDEASELLENLSLKIIEWDSAIEKSNI